MKRAILGIIGVLLLVAARPWDAAVLTEQPMRGSLTTEQDGEVIDVWDSPFILRASQDEPGPVSSWPGRAPLDSPPPLSRSCGGGTVPIDDYSNPVCCVNGYVFLNGEPISGADVTITSNGVSRALVTHDYLGRGRPYYTTSLSGEPLNIEPGDEVTVHASFDGLVKEVSFIAAEGGQQIDLVLPQTTVSAIWRSFIGPPATDISLVYDEKQNKTFLFDGALTSDIWEIDNEGASLLDTGLKPDVTIGDYQMVYFPPSETSLLFGAFLGISDVVNMVTWEWDGQDWVQLQPMMTPWFIGMRDMVYDPHREKILLLSSMSHLYIWEWDGQDWERKSSNQFPSVDGYDLAYDPVRQSVILLGGSDGSNTMWEWDGVDWRQLFPATIPSVRSFKMIHNPADNNVILYDGVSVWTWDGINWHLQTPLNQPPWRSSHEMIYNSDLNRIEMFGGSYNQNDFYDMWTWEGGDWTQIFDLDINLPTGNEIKVSKDSVGNLLAVSSNGDTYMTFDDKWSQLELSIPLYGSSSRRGFSFTSNFENTEHVLWGGVDTNGNYPNSTYMFDNTTWQQLSGIVLPSGREGHGLAYDQGRSVWVMFGGLDNTSYYDETWEFDGTDWELLSPENYPAARAYATLTYDPIRQKIVLVGGLGLDGYYNDVWEFNGTDWHEAVPANDLEPPTRSGHAAVYDVSQQSVVIMGGGNQDETFVDTWEWNGVYWQERLSNPTIQEVDHIGALYDVNADVILAIASGVSNSADSTVFYRHQIVSTPLDAQPIATISQIYPRDVRRNADVITLKGMGGDGDGSDVISAYRWLLDGVEIGNTAGMTMTAESLSLGVHTVSFEVQDNEGNWSAPIEQTIYVRDDSGSTGVSDQPDWALLLYVAADNDLDPWLGKSESLSGLLYRLETSLPQDHVKVGVLYDGPDIDDTYRYILNENGAWFSEKVDEARMDDPKTLEDFVEWGYDTFYTDYYALSLIDHANGIVGFGQDLTTNSAGEAFLTPSEIRSALEGATDDGARTIDVVHFDGCSFGLLENAAIVHGLAQYVVASPNTGWGIFAYDVYRREAGQAATPLDYATAVAQNYAASLQIEGFPYTISVMDMAQFDQVNRSVGAFGHALVTYIEEGDVATRQTEIRSLRDASQKYDSVAPVLDIDIEDSYVDIVDFAQRVQTLGDGMLTTAAQAVIDTVITGADPFIVYEASQSGQFEYLDPVLQKNRIYTIDLENTNGLGVFYPPRFSTDASSAHHQYVNHRLFDTTRDSGWTTFIANGLPPHLSFNPPPLSSNYLIEPLIVAGETNDTIFMAITPTQTHSSVGQSFSTVVEVQSLDASFDGATVALDFDPAVLQVQQISLGAALDVTLQNQYDNSLGTIDIALGTFGDPVTGTFEIATIQFSPISATNSTSLIFTQATERKTGVTYDGNFLPIELREADVAVAETSIVGQVALQGRPTAPHATLAVPLEVRFYDPDTQQLRYQFSQATDTSGQVGLAGVVPGMYEIATISPQMLVTRTTVTIVTGVNAIELGTLRAGDINGDNVVQVDDFSLLRKSFGRCDGSASYDGRADLNGDTCVQIADFSLLALNFSDVGESARRLAHERAADRASFVLLPPAEAVQLGQPFSITVMLEADGMVDSGAIYLSYDPAVLDAVDVQGNPYFATVLQEKIDHENGVIAYAAGSLTTGREGDFVFATIRFVPKQVSDSTTVSFIQDRSQRSDIATQGYSILQTVVGTEVAIETVMSLEPVGYLPFVMQP